MARANPYPPPQTTFHESPSGKLTINEERIGEFFDKTLDK